MPEWLSETEQHAWRSVLQMQAALSARLNRDLLERSNISDADYSVLVNLSEAPDGRQRAFELARQIRWEKSRLSHHLTRMQKRGLVRREECLTDARGAFVVITDEGRTTIRAAAPGHVESVRRFFVDVLSPEQLATLATAAEAVFAAVVD